MDIAVLLFGGLASWADCRTRYLPDALLAGMALWVMAWRLGTGTGVPGLVGAVVLAVVLGVLAIASRGGFGWGDWAYGVLLGGALGWGAAVVIFALAMVGAMGWSLVAAQRVQHWGNTWPLAPFFASASVLVVFLGFH